MTFLDFISAVITDLRTLGCDAVPDVHGDLAIWTVGPISVEIRATGENVFVHLRTTGATIAPVDFPMTLRCVREIAVSVAAALDVPRYS